MTLEWSAQLRDLWKAKELRLEVPKDCTLRQALEQAAAQGTAEQAAALLPEGAPQAAVILAINAVQARFDDPAALSEGDRILILSPIAGG